MKNWIVLVKKKISEASEGYQSISSPELGDL